MRLMLDSLALAVEETLAVHGWFDPGRQHKPITVATGTSSPTDPITTNTLAIVATMVLTEEMEVGSDLLQDTSFVVMQFHAENEALGVHLINDLRDAMRGRIAGGMPRGRFPILDLRMATPVPVAYAAIRDVVTDRNVAAVTSVWNRNVHTVACYVDDFHYGA